MQKTLCERRPSLSSWHVSALRTVLRLDNLEDRAETAKALIPVFLARCMECQNWRPVSQFDANYLAVFAVYGQIRGKEQEFLASNRDELPVSRGGGYLGRDVERPPGESDTKFPRIKDIVDAWARAGAAEGGVIKLGGSSHTLLQIGQWAPLQSAGSGCIQFMLLRHGQGTSHTMCMIANNESLELSKTLRAALGNAGPLLKLTSTRPPPNMRLQSGTKEPDGDQTDKVVGRALEPVLESLDSIRRELEVGDLIVRRWHKFLLHCGRGSKNPVSDGWMLDPKTFPNDVTFNTCMPHVPRLIAEAVGIREMGTRGFVHLDKDKAKRQDQLRARRAYCMLFPLCYQEPDEALRASFGPGEDKDGRRCDTSVTAPTLMKAADGALRLRSIRGWKELAFSLHSGGYSEELGFGSWTNTLNATWSGVAMMHLVGPHPQDKDPDKMTDGPNKDFDAARLPANCLMFPLRRFDGQQIGFGLCAVPAHNKLLQTSIKGSELFRIFEGRRIRLSFAWDILIPEFLRIAERVFIGVLGISLATLSAIQQIVCVDRGRELPPGYLDYLIGILFGGFVHNTTQESGLAGVPHVAEAQARDAAALSSRLAVAEVLYNFICELGHSFGKHSVGALLAHAEELTAELTADTDDLQPSFQRVHWRRFHNIGAVTMSRMAALETTAKTEWKSDVPDKGAPATKDADRDAADLPMERIFDFFSTLPGYRLWNATTGNEKLEDLERAYWERVLLLSHAVEWHYLQPLFRSVREGVVETALEVLIHNGFKHAARPPAQTGKAAEEGFEKQWEEAVRIHVAFDRLALGANGIGAILIADSRPEGFSDEDSPLRRFMLEPNKPGVPLESRLFHPRGTQGEDQRRGQGYEVMMACLGAQNDANPMHSLHLYLINRALLHRPDELTLENARFDDHAKSEAPRAEVLVALIKDLVAKYGDRLLPPIARMEQRPPLEGDQGFFLLVQQYPCAAEAGLDLQPPDPIGPDRSYAMWVLDAAPICDDTATYETYFGEKPRPASDYDRVLALPDRCLPQIVLYHTAVDKLRHLPIVTWIERAKARYPKNRRLLLWAVSQEPELYSKARAHGFEGTGHEAFRHWCKSNLEPGRHKGNKEILAQYLAGVFKAKQAKLMLATAENACNRLVNGRCIDSILLKTLTRHYSSMDVPVDPRLRWQLLAAAAERFSPAKGDLSAAARRMKQDVTNLEKAILKGKGTKHT